MGMEKEKIIFLFYPLFRHVAALVKIEDMGARVVLVLDKPCP